MIVLQNPTLIIESLKEGLFCDQEMIKNWIFVSFEALAKSALTWPGYEKYGRKIQKLGDEVYERALKSSVKQLGGLSTIIHGDLWINNMMFKYDDSGKLKEMKFVGI